ncbi:MAG: ASKHA domain-containing protein [Firmicutes bacterium]|nr:ASKHA domain-containing protein [Bacillota bacterium]
MDKELHIKIASVNKDILAAKGDNLYWVLATAGLFDAPCGGQGRCAKCKVRFISKPPLAHKHEQALLNAEHLQAGWRLSCLHEVTRDIEIELVPITADWAKELFGNEMIFLPPIEKKADVGKGVGVAIDIGTTTLAAVLIELSSGRLLASTASLNSQKAYGQDVISRISYATADGGLQQLQKAVIEDIKYLLYELCKTSGIKPQAISFVTIAANPTMIHLLAGVDPTPLGSAPYSLSLRGPLKFFASQFGLPLKNEALLYCVPAVAAYVGGDTVSGLIALDMDTSASSQILLDIGTNGEIALSHKGEIYACSTALGPALEGMNISCGMRATNGAVAEVTIQEDKVLYRTIGNLPPLGLAGSGLISAISALINAGLLNQNGRLLLRYPLIQEKGQRYLLIEESAQLMLTQKDIRQMQLAKAALCAGLETLLKQASCSSKAVDKLWVAGAFGRHLKAQDLLSTGIVPPEFCDKIHYAGNTALYGACLALLSPKARQRAEILAEKIQCIELATLREYQQRFLQAIKFPGGL